MCQLNRYLFSNRLPGIRPAQSSPAILDHLDNGINVIDYSNSDEVDEGNVKR